MSSNTEKKDFFSQAVVLQEKMKKIQEEISKLEIVGISGAGLVKITVNGAHNCRRVELDPSLFNNEDKYILESLIVAAFNDAARRITEIQREKIFSVSNIS